MHCSSLGLHWWNQQLDDVQLSCDEFSEYRSLIVFTDSRCACIAAYTCRYLQCVPPSTIVRNLGVMFDKDLSLTSHVIFMNCYIVHFIFMANKFEFDFNQLTARCYSCVRRIKSCWRALTRSTAVTVVNSLVLTRLDYCNSLLAECSKQNTDKLQRVRIGAVGVIFGGNRRDHVTPLLWDHLHCLRAPECITFKLCMLMYKAMNALAPSYLQELCVSVSSVTSTRATLYAPQPMVIFSYHGQDDYLACGYSVSLVLPPGTVYQQTFELHRHLQTLNSVLRHICLFCPIVCIPKGESICLLIPSMSSLYWRLRWIRWIYMRILCFIGRPI